MELALAKFFLDAARQLREVVIKRKEQQTSDIATGTFLELYGSCMRLDAMSARVRAIKRESKDHRNFIPLLIAFFEEVEMFCKILARANVAAIDIYHPDLADALSTVIQMEASVNHYLLNTLVPEYVAPDTALNKMVTTYVEHYVRNGTNDWLAQDSLDPIKPSRDLFLRGPSAKTWSDFDELSTAITELKNILRDVVASTWKFQELATFSSDSVN